MHRTAFLSLALLLSACGPGGSNPPEVMPPGPQQPAPAPFDAHFTPSQLTLTNRAQGSVTYALQWNGYQGTLYSSVNVVTPHPNFKTTWRHEAKTIDIDANGAPPGEYAINLTVSNETRTQSITRTLRVLVTLDPRVPNVQAVPVQTLQAGQQLTVPLNIQPPANGTPIEKVQATSAAPELVGATLSGSSVVLQAAQNAPQQGLLPIIVSVTSGTEVVTVRIPVQIGSLIDREYQRYNAVRAQANLAPATLDVEASMNCWLHGRYSVMNGRLEHNQNPSLPFASPEGQACATTSNIAMHSMSPSQLGERTPSVDTLFTAPFHAVGMLRPEITRVGIGEFAVTGSSGFISLGSGITSIREARAPAPGPMTFPGQGAVTDLGSYNGGEWPDPLASCPAFVPSSTGLPLIAATLQAGETTASDATLTVEGQSVPVCAYGSTQYTNTKDADGNYAGGYRSAQEIGRSILKGSGAVIMIPQTRLQAGKTYQASIKINGAPVTWTFQVASALRPQSVDPHWSQQVRPVGSINR